MTIKNMEEEAKAQKHDARAAKKAAVQAARAATQRQLNADCKRRIEGAKRENARASEAHENGMQEVKREFEAQKKTAEQTAAAAATERQSRDLQTRHEKEMSMADAKINNKKPNASQPLPTDSNGIANDLRAQLSAAEEEKTKELAAKDDENKKLQARITDRDSEIRRLRTEAQDAHKDKMAAIREKDILCRSKVDADRAITTLNQERESWRSKSQEAESRAVGAEGRARGLQDRLVVLGKRAAEWEERQVKEEADARDAILSAYAVPGTAREGSEEEDQQSTTTTSSLGGQEEGLSVLVTQQRKGNEERETKNASLAAEVKEWKRVWEKACNDQEAWRQDFIRHHREDQKKQQQQQQVATASADPRATNENGATEKDIRRQCEDEKQEALAAERENGRLQWEAQKCSLKTQFALRDKSHTDHEVQRLRRRARRHQKQPGVQKRHVKWDFNRAVSHAVGVEWSSLRTRLQSEFEMEASRHKSRIDSEHADAQDRLQSEFQKKLATFKTEYASERADSQTQSGGQNNTGAADQSVLDTKEVKKRDEYIAAIKKRLGEAYDAKRATEQDLITIKAENARLSGSVLAYQGQTIMANQTKSEAQTALMAADLVRALTLLSEIAILGLDEKHRTLLGDLLAANKVVRDIRCAIEDSSSDSGSSIDHEEFKNQLDRIVASSDDSENLDPQERPALHRQLDRTYLIVGGVINILNRDEQGGQGATDSKKEQMLERIYRDCVKGKGKQGGGSGAVASASSSLGAANGTIVSAPSPPHPPAQSLFKE